MSPRSSGGAVSRELRRVARSTSAARTVSISGTGVAGCSWSTEPMRAARIGSVDQEHPATPVPLIDTVLAADVERATLLNSLETAPPEDLGDIYSRLIEIDADRAPSRAAEILAGLGF